jgi:hypothetical protein
LSCHILFEWNNAAFRAFQYTSLLFSDSQGFEAARQIFEQSQLETLQLNKQLEENQASSNPVLYHSTISGLLCNYHNYVITVIMIIYLVLCYTSN